MERKLVDEIARGPDLLPIEGAGLYAVQEGGNDDGSVFLDLRGEAE